MDQCPNCRARNPGNPQCRRCGMDLRQLLAVEAAADQRIREALESLAAGDEAACQALLTQAAALHHDPMIDLIRGLADHKQANHPEPHAPASTSGRPDYPY